MSKRMSYLFILAASLIILSLAIYSLKRIEFPANTFIVSLLHLPHNAHCSLNQVFAAHLLPVLFTVACCCVAAMCWSAEKMIVSKLAVLPSVYVLAFSPVPANVFVNTFSGNRIGIEVASSSSRFTRRLWDLYRRSYVKREVKFKLEY
jgi:ABC-type anion transport system duplicated permease subunit